MKCSYCKSEAECKSDDGKVFTVFAAMISTENLTKYGIPDDERRICFPCYYKMFDWLAKESGCIKNEGL